LNQFSTTKHALHITLGQVMFGRVQTLSLNAENNVPKSEVETKLDLAF